MNSSKKTLKTAFTTSSLQEAHIVKALLGGRGINCYLFDENITSTIGTAFVEGYKLKVSTNDSEKAEEIIEEYLEDR